MPGVLAIDPGPERSGVVHITADGRCLLASTHPNGDVLELLRWLPYADTVTIEMVASYGMPVGASVFDTCVWIGRFQQAAAFPDAVLLVPRLEVKLFWCHSARATDATVWRAILDRVGPTGTKKAPGPLYGVKGHARAAFALAEYVRCREAGAAKP